LGFHTVLYLTDNLSHAPYNADALQEVGPGPDSAGGRSMKLRILIADDHELVRRGLCTLLQAHEGWEICGEAKDGREAVQKAKQLNPDVPAPE
jgi:PleD family two-component response regulator